MHSAISQQPLTDAHPRAAAVAPQLIPPSFIVQYAIWFGISLWPVGVSCPG